MLWALISVLKRHSGGVGVRNSRPGGFQPTLCGFLKVRFSAPKLPSRATASGLGWDHGHTSLGMRVMCDRDVAVILFRLGGLRACKGVASQFATGRVCEGGRLLPRVPAVF